MTAIYNYDRIRNDYMTPPEVYKPILEKIGKRKFDLDVCCSKKNIPAKKHFIDGEMDGLNEAWCKINWMNPPFTTCEHWVRKAVEEQLKGNTTFSILPVRTESLFWRECIFLNGKPINPNVDITFLIKNKKEGVTFINPDTGDYVRKDNGEKGLFKNALALVIFKGVKNG
ncbi:MAG: DNA N-6-adenine-methyltransferase [bacterium]